ncbi:Versicolorin B desaturase [Cercospora zeina]
MLSSNESSAQGIGRVLTIVAALPFIYIACHIFYNLYLHPLRSYPGPLLWRASNLPAAYYALQGRLDKKLLHVHREYGKEIRIAPDELSFADARAWKDICGPKPEFRKDPRYLQYPPNGSHSSLTGPREEHARFRRLLSHAFSDKGLREQEPRVRRYVDLLMDRLREVADKPASVDIVDWYTMTVFDILGELAWGESFHGLEERQVHEWIPAILANVKYVSQNVVLRGLGLERLTPYLADPELLKGRKKNYMLAAGLASRRAEYKGEPRGDFWDRVLIESEGDDKVAIEGGMTTSEMINNAVVLVLAGAETSATTLSGATYLLLKHPDITNKVVNEIRAAFKSDEEIDVHSVSRLSYMLAVLDEAMRIYPAVSQPAHRVSPLGGEPSPISRERADDFVPERWLDEAPEELSNDAQQAFQPFSMGSRNCIGRNLAYAEMRLILAKLLFHFDLELDAEKTGDWFNQQSFAIWWKGPLYVKLSPPKRV